MPVTYVKIPFAYRCGVCQSPDMEIIQEVDKTDVAFHFTLGISRGPECMNMPIYDDNKNLHEEHDDNDGIVVVKTVTSQYSRTSEHAVAVGTTARTAITVVVKRFTHILGALHGADKLLKRSPGLW